MGKSAFLDTPKESMNLHKERTIYVASNEPLETEHTNVVFIKGDIVSQIQELQNQKGKNIWLYGGGIVADPFIKENIIDEYIIGYIPIILGEGRSLFFDKNPRINLQLIESTIQEGIVISHYAKRK